MEEKKERIKKFDLLRTVIDDYRPLYNSLFYFAKNLSYFQKKKLYKKVYKIFLKDLKHYKEFEIKKKTNTVFENEINITLE